MTCESFTRPLKVSIGRLRYGGKFLAIKSQIAQEVHCVADACVNEVLSNHFSAVSPFLFKHRPPPICESLPEIIRGFGAWRRQSDRLHACRCARGTGAFGFQDGHGGIMRNRATCVPYLVAFSFDFWFVTARRTLFHSPYIHFYFFTGFKLANSHCMCGRHTQSISFS
jgi:hypothetical protein